VTQDLFKVCPVEQTARQQTGARQTKRNTQTPHFRIYSRCTLFDIPHFAQW